MNIWIILKRTTKLIIFHQIIKIFSQNFFNLIGKIPYSFGGIFIYFW